VIYLELGSLILDWIPEKEKYYLRKKALFGINVKGELYCPEARTLRN